MQLILNNVLVMLLLKVSLLSEELLDQVEIKKKKILTFDHLINFLQSVFSLRTFWHFFIDIYFLILYVL